ncbi:hypothetical protein Ccrd_019859 [Cynara cardunculus var. scolymus]|uniref:Uncharacterized protein n=1 Tax=Cynara cardunculus var. scolymus TaxID=59895 RepID=A0A103Y3I9_CYNCS|nr:hypothetical protein Ccrd_019859 [Cynara cardunculus var. scolymus]
MIDGTDCMQLHDCLWPACPVSASLYLLNNDTSKVYS